MNELIQTFNFGINEVRTAIKDNGDVYFCLKDIATVLGIQDTQTKNFNLDEKGVEKIPTPTKGGIQNITFINEQSVHEYFKDRRVRGEWFKVDESEVIRFLECSNYTLKIQTLDVSGNEIFNKIK